MSQDEDHRKSEEAGRYPAASGAGDHEVRLAPVGDDGLRHWSVVGGLVFDGGRLLLVENLRRNGRTDWSPPGGVVDPGEAPLAALTREVREETGLSVAAWTGPIYRVEVYAPDAGFMLRVEAHRAEGFAGSIVIEDPDGIVTAAEFLPLGDAADRLASGPRWVAEPAMAHVRDGVDNGRWFRYRVDGRSGEERVVTRLDDG